MHEDQDERASRGPGARYDLACVLSGCFWAAIAWVLARGAMDSVVLGGLLAAPLIGLVVGRAFLPAYRRTLLMQVFAALLTLYLAVTLFGVAMGLYDLTRPIPGRRAGEVVWQAVLAALWGTTFTGFVAFLWPLSFFNHRLLRRALPSAE